MTSISKILIRLLDIQPKLKKNALNEAARLADYLVRSDRLEDWLVNEKIDIYTNINAYSSSSSVFELKFTDLKNSKFLDSVMIENASNKTIVSSGNVITVFDDTENILDVALKIILMRVEKIISNDAPLLQHIPKLIKLINAGNTKLALQQMKSL